MYRLRVHSHASLSLLCRCSLELRKSQRRPVVCAHLTYKEGEASVLLHSRGLQVQGIIAFTRIGVSLPLWSFRRTDRSYPLFSSFFFSRRSIHPSIPVHGLPWSSMLHDHDDWSFVRFSFVVFPPSFSSGRFDPLPCYTHTDRTFTALSLINGGHRPYKYSRNVPRYLSVSRDRTSHYAQPGLIIYYRADTM